MLVSASYCSLKFHVKRSFISKPYCVSAHRNTHKTGHRVTQQQIFTAIILNLLALPVQFGYACLCVALALEYRRKIYNTSTPTPLNIVVYCKRYKVIVNHKDDGTFNKYNFKNFMQMQWIPKSPWLPSSLVKK
jgi:hypothetical protein